HASKVAKTATCNPIITDARRARGIARSICLAGVAPGPFLKGQELQTEFAVVNLEIAILAARDGVGPALGYFLRHHADVDGVIANIAVAVEPQSVSGTTDHGKVLLQANIRGHRHPDIAGRARCRLRGCV